MGNFRFRKGERLNKKKTVERLFERGSSFSVFPLKVIFIPHPHIEQPLHQVLISVPSKKFKKAVDRNTLKRRIREGYRLNKALLQASPTLCVAYIYMAKEILPSVAIHKAMRLSFERLNRYEKKD